MKHITKISLILACFIAPGMTIASPTSHSMQPVSPNTLYIVNNYTYPIRLSSYKGHAIKKLPITLKPHAAIKVSVALPTKKEAYIGARAVDSPSESILHLITPHAFWGVVSTKKGLLIKGYVDVNIAYSWDNDTIVFCTHKEYVKNHGCRIPAQ